MRNFFFLFAILLMMVFSTTANSALAAEKNYAGNTHEAAIDYLVKKGALTPNANGEYDVRSNVTRGQFASYLAITLQLPHIAEGHTFHDVPTNTALSRYIASATAVGIIKGYPDGSFQPNAYISRQHMATMLKRTLDYLQLTPASYEQTVFKDEATILNEHKAAVQIGAALNIIKGSTQADGTYFMPQNNALISQAASFIQRLMDVAGDPLAHIVEYKVATITNGNIVPKKTYYSLNEATAARQSNEVVLQDDRIIVMGAGSGFVQTNGYAVLNSTTVNDKIGVAGSTQMELLASDGITATVRLMGQEGTMDVAKLDFYPFALSKGRSYYTNRNGEIYHVLVNPQTGNATASFSFGTAPSFMQQGVAYYSWNGVDFFTASGQKVGEYYNYYQMLPSHTKTAYSAEELDAYIMTLLAQREALGLERYNGATVKSKLIGLGTTLKAIEEQYHINASMMLAIALNESDFGMSNHALIRNNLFGLYVTDTNPLNAVFPTAGDSVIELATKFLVPNYITPGGSARGNFGHGAALGSKYFGFNVKYASDPYWGQKAAGHYYRLDKALGGKDAAMNYTIGLTTQYVNVRSLPSTEGNTPLFQYARANYPVLIKSSLPTGWHEIVSDVDRTSPAYISSSYVKIIAPTK